MTAVVGVDVGSRSDRGRDGLRRTGSVDARRSGAALSLNADRSAPMPSGW
jgi:hypothetical protein